MKIKKMKYKFLGILVVGFLAYFFGISIVKGAGNCNPFYDNYAGCLYGCRLCRDDCAFCMAEPGQDCTDDCDCEDSCDCEMYLNGFCSCMQGGGVSSFGGGDTLCGISNSNGNASGGNASGGNASGGNASGGNASGGNASGGNASGGNASGGNASGGNASGGNASGGNASGGNASGSNVSGGSSQGNGGLINCSLDELMSPGGCETYSSDSSRYCSMDLEGSTNTPGITKYLDHLDQETKDKYIEKFQNQSNRFSKLMEMYNEGHPTAAIEHGAGFAGLEQVGSLNYLMGAYGLSHSEGCKLGNATLDTFFTANLCVLIYGSDAIEAGDNDSCPQGYDPQQYSCCTKAASCDNPATPQTAEGVCGSGFQNNGSGCCVSICTGENMVYHSLTNTCTGCVEGETKPNESHTRCICDPDYKCCGVQLNTVVPFIGDCIEMNAESNRDTTTNVNSVTAFPILMQGLMKILMSVIMIFSFLMIIVAGLMIVSGAFGGNGFSTGKKIIKNVIISLILLGCSGLILSLINPSFFGG